MAQTAKADWQTNAPQGKVPAVVFVKEGYTLKEVAQKVLDGMPVIGRQGGAGPTPPFRMPGWAAGCPSSRSAISCNYLFSLYPTSAEDSWR